MAKYYSYMVTMGNWSYSCRAPDAETAKLTAAQWYQKHKTPMSTRPKTLISLMSKMHARRRYKDE